MVHHFSSLGLAIGFLTCDLAGCEGHWGGPGPVRSDDRGPPQEHGSEEIRTAVLRSQVSVVS